MKQKHKRHVLNRYTVSLLIIIIAGACAAVVFKHNTTDAAPKSKVTPPASIPSQFSFTGTPDWWQGATNKTSMALFHKVQDGCFTSVQHKAGTVDIAAALHKRQDSLAGDGYTVTPGKTLTLTVQTPTGLLHYPLYQSSVTTPTGASKVMGGQEFGYLQLSKGYLEVWGYCNTAAQLPATLSALQAIKFDATK